MILNIKLKKKKVKRQRSPEVKTKSSTSRVMVFGTFDLLHPGHISFLKQAKSLGKTLVVSVARDKNVEKFKGYLPVFNEKERLENIKRLKIANRVVLADLKDPWKQIKKQKPDIIALGYDQKPYVAKTVEQFEKRLKNYNLKARVVRLKAFRPKIYKTEIIRKVI